MTTETEVRERLTMQAVAMYRKIAIEEIKVEFLQLKLNHLLRHVDIDEYVRLTVEIDRAVDKWREAYDNDHYAEGTKRQMLSQFVGNAGRVG